MIKKLSGKSKTICQSCLLGKDMIHAFRQNLETSHPLLLNCSSLPTFRSILLIFINNYYDNINSNKLHSNLYFINKYLRKITNFNYEIINYTNHIYIYIY